MQGLLGQAFQCLHHHRGSSSGKVREFAHHLKRSVDHLLIAVIDTLAEILQNTAPQIALQIGIQVCHPRECFLGQHLYIHVLLLHLTS